MKSFRVIEVQRLDAQYVISLKKRARNNFEPSYKIYPLTFPSEVVFIPLLLEHWIAMMVK